MTTNSGDHSHRYFYTIYLIKSKPNAFYSSYRMPQLPSQPQLMISGCNDQLLVDLSLLKSFSEDEWISFHELPHLCTLCFHIVSEELFSQLVSLELWGQARVEFITSSSRKTMSDEIISMVILVTDGVGEGAWEWQPSFAVLTRQKWSLQSPFWTLFQWNPPYLGIVVVKIFTNSLYVPWQSFGFHYLDVTTLSVGASTAQFPLAQLCLCRLLLYSSTQVILP